MDMYSSVDNWSGATQNPIIGTPLQLLAKWFPHLIREIQITAFCYNNGIHSENYCPVCLLPPPNAEYAVALPLQLGVYVMWVYLFVWIIYWE